VRRSVALLVAASCAFVLVGTAAASQPDRDETEVRRVLVVTYPATRWADVDVHRPPVLDSLLERSALGSMSVRTIGPLSPPGRAYATIGSGNRATAEEATAGQAHPPPASVEGDAAVQVFERRCGCPSEGAAVLHLGMPRLTRANDRLLYGTVPGALGEALREAGIGVGVVGNADLAVSATGIDVHREVSLAGVDTSGRVPFGSVGPQLVVKDPGWPYGVRSDPEAVVSAAEAAWSGAHVLFVEMSDLDRVDRYADVASRAATTAARGLALEAADTILVRLLAGVDLEQDLVMVIGPTAPRGPSQLTIAAVAGPGFGPGELRSATTRRAGYVTLPDVAPTILTALGVPVASDMTGAIMSSVGDRAASYRSLADENERAMFRDEAQGPASVSFIVFQVLTYALAAVALTRWRPARRWVAVLALTTLAVPPLAFLSGLVRYDALGVAGYVVVLFLAAALVAAAALGLGHATRGRTGDAAPLVPPLVLVGLTLAVLVGDIATGGHLQINTVFGYSPIVAGRFAGYGNLAFALLAATAVMFVTGVWGATVLRGGRRWAFAAVATLLVLVVLVDGLPGLGSDVGGVLALVPASAVILLLLSGRRLDLRRGAVIAIATAGVLAVFALVDLARPEESRTHLGRLAASLLDDGGGGAVTVVQRKINANVSILTSSVWTWIIPFAVAFLAFVVWRRPGLLRGLEERFPGLRAGLVGALVAGGLGFALNDSGVAIPAMMLGVVLPYVTHLAVREP
jgi:hypothetical protein